MQLSSYTNVSVPSYEPEKMDSTSHINFFSSDIPYQFPPIHHFKEISSRPLFTPGRRKVQSTNLHHLGQYWLRGVALFNNHKIGLLERRSDGEAIRVFEGDIIDGWEIILIDSHIIKMTDASRRVTAITIAPSRTEDTSGTYHDDVINADHDDNLYAYNKTTQEITLPQGLGRRFVPADHLRVQSNAAARQKDTGAADYNGTVFTQPLLLPPPPPLPPRYNPMQPE